MWNEHKMGSKLGEHFIWFPPSLPPHYLSFHHPCCLSHWPHYNFHYPCNYHNTYYYFVILLSHCHIICLVIPPIVELLVPSWLHCLGLDLCNFHYPSNYLTYNWCFWHKIIHKRCSWKKIKKIKLMFCQKCRESNSQLVKKKILFKTITNTQQQKVYFAYFFFNCWNFIIFEF